MVGDYDAPSQDAADYHIALQETDRAMGRNARDGYWMHDAQVQLQGVPLTYNKTGPLLVFG